MAEQYVFSVAFDRHASEIPVGDIGLDNTGLEDDTGSETDSLAGGKPGEQWAETLQAIANALQTASLGSLESDRWEEYGDGRIFWGTRVECTAVRDVLREFEVDIAEERNIETGYYSTDDELYYVADAGDIVCLGGTCPPAMICVDANNVSVVTVQSMPLDAYPVTAADLDAVSRLRTVGTLAFYLANQVDPSLPPSALAQEETVTALATILTAPTRAEERSDGAMPEGATPDASTDSIGSRPDEAYFDAIASETIHTSAVSDLERRIAELESELARAAGDDEDSGAIAVGAELEAVRADAERVERENDELKVRLTSQSRILEEERARSADVNTQAAADAASTRQTLQAEIAHRDRTIVQLEAQRDELQAQQSDYQALQQQLSERTQAIAALETQLTESNERVVAAIDPDSYRMLQQQMEAAARTVADMETQLSAANELAASSLPPEMSQALQQQLEERTREIADLQRQLADSRAAAEAKIDLDVHHSLQQQFDEKNRAIAQLETQLDEARVRTEDSVAPEVHQALHQQLDEKTQAIAALETQLAHQIDPEAHQALQQQLDEKTHAIATLDSQISELRAQAEGKVEPEAHQALQQQFDEKTHAIAALETRLTEREQAVAQLEGDLAARLDPEAQRSLQDQLDAQTETIAVLERELAAARAEVEQQIDPEHHRTLQQQLVKLKTVAEARIDPIEHRTLQRKSAALVGQIKLLQAQLEKANEPRSLWATLMRRRRQS